MQFLKNKSAFALNGVGKKVISQRVNTRCEVCVAVRCLRCGQTTFTMTLYVNTCHALLCVVYIKKVRYHTIFA
jgi:hypothetical protein